MLLFSSYKSYYFFTRRIQFKSKSELTSTAAGCDAVMVLLPERNKKMTYSPRKCDHDDDDDDD